jgi:parvulin-like peptidyl-prolyl isomerase
MAPHQLRPFVARSAASSLVIAGAIITGCAASGSASERAPASPGVMSPPRVLRPGDFSNRPAGRALAPLDVNAVKPSTNPATATTARNGADASAQPALASGVDILSVDSVRIDNSSRASGDIIATPGLPAGRGEARPIGPAVFIDAKLGDINGNPILASVFLDTGSTTVEPIGRFLAEEARRRPLAQWRTFARDEVTKRVALFVRDEILRAEALATLNQDQRVGFLAFIDRLQRDAQRRMGGSRAVAERTLSQTEGVTFDEWKRRERDRNLVQFQVQEKVSKRVQVSGRDIAQRYDQLYDTFNRPPLATFRQVVIPAANADAIAAFQASIDAGESFESLARSEKNTHRRATGGLEAREIPGDRAAADLFANPKLNQAARTLEVGQVAGPIDVSAGKAWLYLESIEDREQDLYEAQLALEDRIRDERFNRALERYFTRLASRMNITDTSDVVEQLLEIAERRYFPQLPKATPAATSPDR